MMWSDPIQIIQQTIHPQVNKFKPIYESHLSAVMATIANGLWNKLVLVVLIYTEK